MAIKELKREWCPSQLAYVKEFLLHREEELQHMPRCSVGSKATVSETDNEYVKTTDGWKLLCDCDEDGGQGAGGGGGVQTVNGIAPDENGNVQVEAGGSGGAFVVNVNVEDWENPTVDKTISDIIEAIQSGCVVQARYDESYGIIRCLNLESYKVGGGGGAFVSFGACELDPYEGGGDNLVVHYLLHVNADNTATITAQRIEIPMDR